VAAETMQALTGERLLAAWDRGAAEHDLSRAVTMLAAALPGTGREHLSAAPIAERNALLLRLHELTFGPLLSVFGVCPQCQSPFEFGMPAAVMTGGPAGPAPAHRMVWHEDGRQYALRAVTTDDLLAVLGEPEAEAAQDLLLARCLEASPGPGRPPARAGILPRFEELNGPAELTCSVDCPQCSRRADLDLDMARFLWAEVRTAARRLLSEIHQLAIAYGWSERDIAGMSATRRAAYLEMLSA
jgi:hypothetical protein